MNHINNYKINSLENKNRDLENRVKELERRLNSLVEQLIKIHGDLNHD